MPSYIILGGYGNIGKVIAKDLFQFSQGRITIAGHDEKKAEAFAKSFKTNRIGYTKVDVTNVKKLSKILKNYDVCINATQYYYNLHVMKACLKARTNYLDLGGLFHMTKKQLHLHKNFKKIKKIALLGCGSTPGITNVMASYAAQFFDVMHSIEISFADADFTDYKQKFVTPYTFYTIADEFTLNPYVLHQGKLKAATPLSGEKELYFSKFPEEMRNKKGFYALHSELATFPNSFKSKGLKDCNFRVTFPQEFIEKIKTLIDLGLASQEPVQIKGKKLKIIDISAKIMDQWLPNQKITDEEIVRVDVLGKRNNKRKRLVIDAHTKSKDIIPAGTYDTAVPASIIASMIANGVIGKKGVFSPEQCIPEIKFFHELEKRGIIIWINNQKFIERDA